MHHYDACFKTPVTFERKEIFPIRKKKKYAEFNVEYKYIIIKFFSSL